MERALSDKLVDVLENRAEIGRRLADKLEMRHVVGKFLRVVNDPVRAQLVVALQDAQVDAAEKARALLEQLAGPFEKGADELARGGHGGVDGDDEILDFARLARFQRLDQRHIAVAAQTVGIVAVVERVCVDGGLLAQGGKPPQKGAVVGRAARGDGKLLAHGLAAGRFAGENRIHGGLGALRLLLPAAVLIVIILGPERVLIDRENACERRAVVGIHALAAEMAVDRLSCQHRHMLVQRAVKAAPPHRGLVRREAAVIQTVEQAFDRNVARERPEIAVAAAHFRRMAQQTVKDRVQIGAVDARAAALEALRKPRAAEIQCLGIGRERARLEAVLHRQRRECAVEKRQVHIKLAAGGKQDFAPDIGPSFGLHGRASL